MMRSWVYVTAVTFLVGAATGALIAFFDGPTMTAGLVIGASITAVAALVLAVILAYALWTWGEQRAGRRVSS